jgi:hypothetical protein
MLYTATTSRLSSSIKEQRMIRSFYQNSSISLHHLRRLHLPASTNISTRQSLISVLTRLKATLLRLPLLPLALLLTYLKLLRPSRNSRTPWNVHTQHRHHCIAVVMAVLVRVSVLVCAALQIACATTRDHALNHRLCWKPLLTCRRMRQYSHLVQLPLGTREKEASIVLRAPMSKLWPSNEDFEKRCHLHLRQCKAHRPLSRNNTLMRPPSRHVARVPKILDTATRKKYEPICRQSSCNRERSERDPRASCEQCVRPWSDHRVGQIAEILQVSLSGLSSVRYGGILLIHQLQ